MLDDLSAGAFQMHQQQEAPKAGPVTSIGKTVRYTISDFLEYRPSRSAAQAFLGTNRPSNRDYSPGSKQDPRPNRLISATTEVERESARNESAFQVTTAMMQLAKGFGDLDREAGEKSKEQAIQRLNELLGEGQTRWLVSRFASWATSVESQARREMEQTTKTVDIIDQEDLVNVLAREAAAHDSTTANLKASLGLHDRSPSKAEVILTGATLTPTIIGPAALLTERTLERANGGDRCKRLEVVLALGLNLQERLNLLTRQSALAISSLDRARLSKNTTMYAFSRDLIKKLQGKEPPPAIAGAAKLTP